MYLMIHFLCRQLKNSSIWVFFNKIIIFYQYYNYKQIGWWYTGSAFLGLKVYTSIQNHTETTNKLDDSTLVANTNDNIDLASMLFSNKEHEGAVLPISIQNLYLLQTFWVYLTMSLLYERVLKMLPRINIILRFYQQANLRHISLTQHKMQYNTGIAM